MRAGSIAGLARHYRRNQIDPEPAEAPTIELPVLANLKKYFLD
jgi:hypothetical protein